MKQIYCSTKGKKVNITQTYIKAGTLEGHNATVPGLINCSDNNYHCDYEKCPLKNITR